MLDRDSCCGGHLWYLFLHIPQGHVECKSLALRNKGSLNCRRKQISWMQGWDDHRMRTRHLRTFALKGTTSSVPLLGQHRTPQKSHTSHELQGQPKERQRTPQRLPKRVCEDVFWNWSAAPSPRSSPTPSAAGWFVNSLIHCMLHLPKAGNPSPPPSPSSLPAASFDGIFFLPALACSLLLSLPELGLFPSPNYSCRRADGRGSGFLTRWECASLYRH